MPVTTDRLPGAEGWSREAPSSAHALPSGSKGVRERKAQVPQIKDRIFIIFERPAFGKAPSTS